ncbi:unnamed protein product, partial [marine sediment metagenome]
MGFLQRGFAYGNKRGFASINPPESGIDIGSDPIEREDMVFPGSTYIDMANPANASGTLNTIQVFPLQDLFSLKVATFYRIGGEYPWEYTLKCRDSVLIGDVPGGALRTYNGLTLAVEAEDWIGCYFFEGLLCSSPFGYTA